MSLYAKRGVSAQKEEVHAAVKNLDQGLFPNAFCKVYPDFLGGDDAFVNIMHTIIIGYDHRFGKERVGDYKLMEDKAIVYNYRLMEIPVHLLDTIKVSSSNIREAILHGRIEEANKLLGYQFFFEGEVVHGDKIGRTLGYPTANLKSTDEEKIVLGDGIYAVYTEVEGKRYKAMMSIGFRPTVNGKKRVIEVNIFDFENDIYGRVIRVYVVKYLRSEVKFDGLEALRVQLGKDKEDSLSIL